MLCWYWYIASRRVFRFLPRLLHLHRPFNFTRVSLVRSPLPALHCIASSFCRARLCSPDHKADLRTDSIPQHAPVYNALSCEPSHLTIPNSSVASVQLLLINIIPAGIFLPLQKQLSNFLFLTWRSQLYCCIPAPIPSYTSPRTTLAVTIIWHT